LYGRATGADHHSKFSSPGWKIGSGIATLSQIEQDLLKTANAEAWDFNHLAGGSIAPIWLFSLNVTIPIRMASESGLRPTLTSS
jgi:hypothetical protein